ncbi:hypothetical protein BJ878DRAFT_571566 [Calycina marina]|uniref:Uncharacterized protein n=1 Tax=Calycina marina TaxID=1763456 RepID=A0A9P8CC29_9HELO|nr:hypothetical protein BJ878DRAFT_571566 [Calycina marina]
MEEYQLGSLLPADTGDIALRLGSNRPSWSDNAQRSYGSRDIGSHRIVMIQSDPQYEARPYVTQGEDDHPLVDFEAFARRRPQEDFTRIDLLGDLGAREIDRDYDWSLHIGRYETSPEIWDQLKAENPIAQVVIIDSLLNPLNLEQRKLYDTVVDQYS